MQVHVRLHGILRDSLPPADKGRATLTLRESATLQDLFDHFQFTRPVQATINDEIEPANDRPLRDGDQVAFFTVIGGG
jgi:sulfur carrier protein ThiS